MKKIENIKYANEHERQVLDLYLPDKEGVQIILLIVLMGKSAQKRLRLSPFRSAQTFSVRSTLVVGKWQVVIFGYS